MGEAVVGAGVVGLLVGYNVGDSVAGTGVTRLVGDAVSAADGAPVVGHGVGSVGVGVGLCVRGLRVGDLVLSLLGALVCGATVVLAVGDEVCA